MTTRYRAEALERAVRELFEAAGHEPANAEPMASILLDADLMGYTTHGLQFVPAYVREAEQGLTALTGRPGVASERGGSIVLDGRGLPGQRVMVEALELGLERLPGEGQVTIAIRDTRNVGSLAAYMRRVAEAGVFGFAAASAPSNAVVAPFGGRQGRLSTNPFAFAVPARPTPIIVDTSAAAVTNRMTERAVAAGEKLDGPWLVDADGRPTDDPAVMFEEPKGAILPLGGLAQGYKGFALGLLIEALTSGLNGAGRAVGAGGQSAMLMLIDPEAFAGREAFVAEASHTAAACRATLPMEGASGVRVPGDRALGLRERQLADGVELYPGIMQGMVPLLDRYGVPRPEPL